MVESLQTETEPKASIEMRLVVPAAIHAAFKSACLGKSQYMTGVIVQLMRNYAESWGEDIEDEANEE